jgi:hypothetical protein
MASVLASPPGDACCNPTTFVHEGTPQGSIITVADLQTYISRPSEGKSDKIILFFPDVYGPMHVNNQLVADYFASNGTHPTERTTRSSFLIESILSYVLGYLVIAPDYFEGDPIHLAREKPDHNRDTWLSSKLARAKQTTPKWIDAVVKEFGMSFQFWRMTFEVYRDFQETRRPSTALLVWLVRYHQLTQESKNMSD